MAGNMLEKFWFDSAYARLFYWNKTNIRRAGDLTYVLSD